MRTVELFEQALAAADKLGYRVRHEWLGGVGGGACEFGGNRWIFVDLSLSIEEQFEQVAESLRADPAIDLLPIDIPLRRRIELRRAA